MGGPSFRLAVVLLKRDSVSLNLSVAVVIFNWNQHMFYYVSKLPL